jgi:hypothetical protein
MRTRAWVVTLLAVLAAQAHADVTGSWRVGFIEAPGQTPQEFCRFDLVEAADGQVQGYLGICGIGTDGLLSGTVDASGTLSLRIVAPDDLGCETYGIAATIVPGGNDFEGTFLCDFPIQQGGYVVATRCDPLTPGSCPEVSGASLPPRPHEVRACTPEPATSPCHGSVDARARLRMERDDTYHYSLKFKLPDAMGITVADLGDPTTVRDFVICVYQAVGTSPSLLAMEPAWAAYHCNERPCWQLQTNGVRYRNPEASRGKLTRLKAKVRGSGTSNVVVKGRVTIVSSPPVDLPLELPILVRLFSDDTCLGATFTSAMANEPNLFDAKNGQ